MNSSYFQDRLNELFDFQWENEVHILNIDDLINYLNPVAIHENENYY